MEKLKAVVEIYREAYLKHDAEALDSVLADDWSLVTVSGRVSSKEKQLSYLREKTLAVSDIEDSSVEYRDYGNAAVVTGCRSSKAEFRESDVSDTTRFTQFYVRQNENWKCVAAHVTSTK